MSEQEDEQPSRLPSRSSSQTASRNRRVFDYSTPDQRPFSKSAAKRSSVMALGSISHLQHYFVKEAKKASAPTSSSSGLKNRYPNARAMPGIGKSGDDEDQVLTVDEEDEEDDLPPTPMPPNLAQQQLQQPWLTEERPLTAKEVRFQCCQHVERVCEAWRIIDFVKSQPSISSVQSSPEMSSRSLSVPSPEPYALPSAKGSENIGMEDSLILQLLHVTTAAIRAVQQFVLSLPPDALMGNLSLNSRSMGDSSLSSRHNSHLGLSTAARPRTSIGLPNLVSKRPASSPSVERHSKESSERDEQDPADIVRKSCLEILGMLRAMDDKYRLPSSNAGDQAAGSTSMARRASNISDASAASDDVFEGHLYKQVRIESLAAEQDKIRKWIELVDSVLFTATKRNGQSEGTLTESPVEHVDSDAGDGPRPARSPTPLGMHEDVRQQMPAWAKHGMFEDSPLRCAHAVLTAHLPVNLLFQLSPPHSSSGDPEDGSRALFLDSLADGQLLCIAFNAALRQSARPWGFIQPEEIHNIASLTISLAVAMPENSENSVQERRAPESSSARIGMTFRRLENLRVWVAAIRLRYSIGLGPAKERNATKESVDSLANDFDVKIVAKKETGWENMLEFAVLRWTEAVCYEKREELE